MTAWAVLSALLGGLAAGAFPDLPTAVAGLAQRYSTTEPRANRVEPYDAHYRRVYSQRMPGCVLSITRRCALRRDLTGRLTKH